jgi:hypothetical protein
MSFVSHIHDLLLNHCTRSTHGDARSLDQRQRYKKRVESILASSQLGPRTEDQVWDLGWDKPFFSNNKASKVEPAVQLARKKRVFSDRLMVTSDEFMKGEEPGPMVVRAKQSGQLKGACAAAYRLAYVQSYARSVPRITKVVNQFHNDWQRGTLASDQLQERAVAIAEDIGVGGGLIGKVNGFGFTTACHLLADLGLPLFKPDIWICRIVSSLPGVQAEIRRIWQLPSDLTIPFDFLEKKLVGPRAPYAYRCIVQPVMNALVKEMQTSKISVAEFDLAPAFRFTRFVDWTVVHFAISTKPEVYGLERRPVDLLLSTDETKVPKYLKALANWLDAGQSSHEAILGLNKAKAKCKKAKTPEARALAQRRLLKQQQAEHERSRLADQARAAWIDYEAACTAISWVLYTHYPKDVK